MPPLGSLHQLLARAEIDDVLKRYTRALDRLDEDALRSCFHADATLRLGGQEVTEQDFCASVMGILRELELTHHQIGNVHIEFADDAAFVETYLTAIHRIGAAGWSPYPQANPGDDLMMRGRYIDRFERRDGVWAIAHRTLIIDWARFDPSDDRGIIADSPEPRSRRDRMDPVYNARSLS